MCFVQKHKYYNVDLGQIMCRRASKNRHVTL